MRSVASILEADAAAARSSCVADGCARLCIGARSVNLCTDLGPHAPDSRDLRRRKKTHMHKHQMHKSKVIERNRATAAASRGCWVTSWERRRWCGYTSVGRAGTRWDIWLDIFGLGLVGFRPLP
eukprot:5955109-Prymnesium_polylepis.2